MRQNASPTSARRLQAHEAQGQTDPLRRHRRLGHERHRRGAAQPGLRRQRFGHREQRGHAPARRARREGDVRPRRRAHRGGRLRGHLDRGAGGQPRGGRRASQAHPGRSARADARRADEAQAGRRDRRDPRQDDHHEPGLVGARAGRARPHFRDRRAPEQRRRQCAAGQRRLHRRRGRRIGRLVPEPVSDDRGDHEHRRGPHGDLRTRLRAAQAGLRRVHPPTALLRRGGAVHRRSERARDHPLRLQAGDHLRFRERSPVSRGRRSPRRRTHALQAAARGQRSGGRACSMRPACTTCRTRWPRSRSPTSSA